MLRHRLHEGRLALEWAGVSFIGFCGRRLPGLFAGRYLQVMQVLQVKVGKAVEAVKVDDDAGSGLILSGAAT